VVAADERETGARALLNFGHTFGHAIETATGYGTWLHGEAVAAGMVLAARFSARRGRIAPRGRGSCRCVERLGLPVARHVSRADAGSSSWAATRRTWTDASRSSCSTSWAAPRWRGRAVAELEDFLAAPSGRRPRARGAQEHRHLLGGLLVALRSAAAMPSR
jgi:hypothetical protein